MGNSMSFMTKKYQKLSLHAVSHNRTYAAAQNVNSKGSTWGKRVIVNITLNCIDEADSNELMELSHDSENNIQKLLIITFWFHVQGEHPVRRDITQTRLHPPLHTCNKFTFQWWKSRRRKDRREWILQLTANHISPGSEEKKSQGISNEPANNWLSI